MKKIFALLLVVLMLVPFIASCKQPNTDTDTNTDTSSATDTSTDTDTDTDTDTGSDSGNQQKPPSNKKDVAEAMKNFEGETVKILTSNWSTTPGGWTQPELCVKDYGDGSNYGLLINDAVMDRNLYVENTYKVKLDWVDCYNTAMEARLSASTMNKGQEGVEDPYQVAIANVHNAMNLVVGDYLYAMGQDYINFDADYFNQECVENYTLAGNTFFAGGDISFLDEHTAFILYYNNEMVKEYGKNFPDLYELVLSGDWTIDVLYNLSASVSKNTDGKDEYTDDDTYGLGTTQLSAFYQYFGVYQVGKGTLPSGTEGYVLTIDKTGNIQTIVQKMLDAKNQKDSIRTEWTGGWSTMQLAFEQGRLLFYHEVLQKAFNFSDMKFGILPFPKLNDAQERYYVPSASQSTVICIPRATTNKVLSECMVEILCKTAGEYIFPAYVDTLAEKLYVGDDGESENEDEDSPALKVVKEQVFPNMMYDLGYMYTYDGLITGSVQGGSIEGGENKFQIKLDEARLDAEDVLAGWNAAYIDYEEED